MNTLVSEVVNGELYQYYLRRRQRICGASLTRSRAGGAVRGDVWISADVAGARASLMLVLDEQLLVGGGDDVGI